MYADNGRRYVIYRGQMDHRSIAVIWRESEGWQGKAFERDKDFVATPKLTKGAEQAFASGDAAIPNPLCLHPSSRRPSGR